MRRLAGFSAREVIRVAEKLSWEFVRQPGSHRIYAKPGVGQRLVIPDKRELGEGRTRDLVHVMGLTVDEFLSHTRR